jgi:hypothetical protein
VLLCLVKRVHRVVDQPNHNPNIFKQLLRLIFHLVQGGLEVPTHYDNIKYHPIYRAAKCDRPLLIKVLLSHGALIDPVEARTGSTRSTLCNAIDSSAVKNAQFLVEIGSPVGVPPTQLTEIPFKHLVSAFPVDTNCPDYTEWIKLAKLMVSRGPVNQPYDSHTPLWWALKQGKFGLAAVFASHNGLVGSQGIYMSSGKLRALSCVFTKMSADNQED